MRILEVGRASHMPQVQHQDSMVEVVEVETELRTSIVSVALACAFTRHGTIQLTSLSPSTLPSISLLHASPASSSTSAAHGTQVAWSRITPAIQQGTIRLRPIPLSRKAHRRLHGLFCTITSSRGKKMKSEFGPRKSYSQLLEWSNCPEGNLCEGTLPHSLLKKSFIAHLCPDTPTAMQAAQAVAIRPAPLDTHGSQTSDVVQAGSGRGF